ncbi:MAG: hypothetical protein K6G63_06915 [Eubacterium sp.]|nr:hypothetical protein [Eubacterium sp.]
MRAKICLVLVLVLCIGLCGCTSDKDGDNKAVSGESLSQLTTNEVDQLAEKIVKKMSIRERIGQMIMVEVDALTGKDNTTKLSEKVKEYIRQNNIGGVVIRTNNMKDRAQVESLTAELAECESMPAYIAAIPEEVATVESPSYETTATEIMGGLGFNLNFDLSGDVAGFEKGSAEASVESAIAKIIGEKPIPPEKTWIKKSSKTDDKAADQKNKLTAKDKKKVKRAKKRYKKLFKKYKREKREYDKEVSKILDKYSVRDYSSRCLGTVAQSVSDRIGKAIADCQNQKLAVNITGFPGITTVAKDHLIVPQVINTGISKLRREHIAVFGSAIENNADIVTVSHVKLGKVDSMNMASMSKIVINDLIRDELEYSGVVITEALDSPVVINQYKNKDAVLNVVNAGADIIYNPTNIDEAIDTIDGAIQSNLIDEKVINQSVIRIVQNKLNRGIIKAPESN